MNKMIWPDYIENAVKGDSHPPNPARMSVTNLSDCPLQRTLWLKHWNEIEKEPEDMLWALYGTALDTIIKKNCRLGMINIKLELKMDDYELVGMPDIYYPETGLLVDAKTTSVWTLKNPRADWTKQLNIYDYLLFRCQPELKVNKLQVHGFARDWRKNEKLRYGDYPDSAFVIIDIPRWSHQEQIDYIDCQMKDHKLNPERECSPEEKWTKPDQFAAYKGKNKTASRVLDTEEEAEQWIKKQKLTSKEFTIVKRSGENVRCNSYCNINSFCPYYNHKEENK